MGDNDIVIQPQAGPQTRFLASPADLTIYGGSAGGGKSWSLLAEPLRHVDVPQFGGVVFRRTTVQIRIKGGLWDESKVLYGPTGAIPREATLKWRFPSGMDMTFAHLEHDNTVYDYQGAQIPYIGFDELTHFSRQQFLYMLSRNRSTCGVRPYMRATCNPDPDSFILPDFVDWYLIKADDPICGKKDPSDPTGQRIYEPGLPHPKRAGKVRWFLNIEDELRWANSPGELRRQYGRHKRPLSFSFIPAYLSDNKILMRKDPSYSAKLDALTKVDQKRLKDGNWYYRAQAGDYFQEGWFPVVDEIPGGFVKVIRAWDRAATRPNPLNPNPDWTRGVLLYVYADGTYCIGDVASIQDTPGNVMKFIQQTAERDTANVAIRAFQDPASAGKMEAEHFVRSLQGYDVEVLQVSSDKATRAKPVSSQAQLGGMRVLRAHWNKAFFKELVDFCEDDSKYDHDDIVDALALAYHFGKLNVGAFSDEAVDNFETFMRTGHF